MGGHEATINSNVHVTGLGRPTGTGWPEPLDSHASFPSGWFLRLTVPRLPEGRSCVLEAPLPSELRTKGVPRALIGFFWMDLRCACHEFWTGFSADEELRPVHQDGP